MEKLIGALRPYVWGSRVMLSKLRGSNSPSKHPEAEIWFGAHPDDPAKLENNKNLLELITSNPEGELGKQIVEKMGVRLPFLVKLLAAEYPLSLQAHPSSTQAIKGFEFEENEIKSGKIFERNYKDPYPKPEMFIALEKFEALAGFAPVETSTNFIEEILEFVETKSPLRNLLSLLLGQTNSEGIRTVFTSMVSAPVHIVAESIDELTAAGTMYLKSGKTKYKGQIKVILNLAELYPKDFGVLASVLLNYIELSPGQAIYIPACLVHSYIRGLGVEVMSSSDNVLRAGLTSKHIDIPELLKIVDFNPIQKSELIIEPRKLNSNTLEYPVKVKEFEVKRINLNKNDHIEIIDRPAIILPVAGVVKISNNKTNDVVKPCEGYWISYKDLDVTLSAIEHNVEFFIISTQRGN